MFFPLHVLCTFLVTLPVAIWGIPQIAYARATGIRTTRPATGRVARAPSSLTHGLHDPMGGFHPPGTTTAHPGIQEGSNPNGYSPVPVFRVGSGAGSTASTYTPVSTLKSEIDTGMYIVQSGLADSTQDARPNISHHWTTAIPPSTKDEMKKNNFHSSETSEGRPESGPASRGIN